MNKLAQILGIQFSNEIEISSITNTTDKVKEGSIFFALKGLDLRAQERESTDLKKELVPYLAEIRAHEILLERGKRKSPPPLVVKHRSKLSQEDLS